MCFSGKDGKPPLNLLPFSFFYVDAKTFVFHSIVGLVFWNSTSKSENKLMVLESNVTCIYLSELMSS